MPFRTAARTYPGSIPSCLPGPRMRRPCPHSTPTSPRALSPEAEDKFVARLTDLPLQHEGVGPGEPDPRVRWRGSSCTAYGLFALLGQEFGVILSGLDHEGPPDRPDMWSGGVRSQLGTEPGNERRRGFPCPTTRR